MSATMLRRAAPCSALQCRQAAPALLPRLHLCPVRPTSWVLSPSVHPADTAQKQNNGEPIVSPVAARAQAAAGGAAESKDSGSFKETLVLGTLFGGWYLANIYFNIYNKQVLGAFGHPISVTLAQFFVGTVLSLVMWTTGIVKKPKITPAVIGSILPLAMVHTLGNLLTNVSLGAVAVSFTHTIKAMEPFFSVVLSALFLGDIPSIPVLLTLLPIAGGVAAASMTEASFNWTGFLSAMGSNLTFQSRNVLSKKLMLKKGTAAGGEPLDNINLFQIITILSGFLLLPVTLLLDGWRFSPAVFESLNVKSVPVLLQRMLLSGLCFHLYQQVSYMILQRVSPVTHSIGNCVKRVVVIIASVIVFRNPVGMQNAIGTAVALAGVFAYSQVKRKAGKAKAE